MNPHNSSTESSTTGEKNNSEKQNGNRSRWLSYLAVFGDSGFALVTSFALLVVAVTVALFLDEEQTGDLSASDEKAYRALGPIPKLEPPRIFDFTSTTKEASSTSDGVFVSDEMRKAFEKDGVIAIRGLIDADLLNLLDISSKDLVREPQQQNELKPKGPLNSRTRKKGTQFFTVKQGAIFLPENNTTDLSAFSKVSLMSKIPLIAADLLQLKEERHETLRLMRDIFLAKDEEEYICGWHVDDTGFWPNTAEASGVNA